MKINLIKQLGGGNFSVNVTHSDGSVMNYNFNHSMAVNDAFLDELKILDIQKSNEKSKNKVSDMKNRFEGKNVK